MSRSERTAGVLLLALALPALASCVAVAVGAAAGYAVTREVLPGDVHSATIAVDVDVVWETAQAALAAISTRPIVVTETAVPTRIAAGVVDGADVTLEVQAFDLDRTIVKVRAERYLTSRGATAQRVLDRVIDRLPPR